MTFNGEASICPVTGWMICFPSVDDLQGVSFLQSRLAAEVDHDVLAVHLNDVSQKAERRRGCSG